MNEYSELTPDLIQKDMQKFLISPYGRPSYAPGIRDNFEAMSLAAREIVSASGVDLRTLMRMCDYMSDINQSRGFNWLSGIDLGQQPSPAVLRRKILTDLQTTLSDSSVSQNPEIVARLYSLVCHYESKPKFPRSLYWRLRYGTSNELEVLQYKMKPLEKVEHVKKKVSEELQKLEVESK